MMSEKGFEVVLKKLQELKKDDHSSLSFINVLEVIVVTRIRIALLHVVGRICSCDMLWTPEVNH